MVFAGLAEDVGGVAEGAGAFLARHHVDIWLDRPLLAVVHGRGRRIGEY